MSSAKVALRSLIWLRWQRNHITCQELHPSPHLDSVRSAENVINRKCLSLLDVSLRAYELFHAEIRADDLQEILKEINKGAGQGGMTKEEITARLLGMARKKGQENKQESKDEI